MFQPNAERQFQLLEKQNPKKHKKVLKTLGFLQTDPRHPGLQTHKYDHLEGPDKEIVFEAYVENNTSGAYRVFWYYKAASKKEFDAEPTIIIIAITPHP
ncbi:hypothetical protein H6G57_28045 [Planktothrix sp. FACHB-1365]|nr:hypothetical protein [Planktothrix sp. FACHB-1365]